MQNEAIFTLTTAELMAYITFINVILIILVISFGLIAYFLINRRITRLNSRITDTHMDVATRSIALAHSFSELTKSMLKDKDVAQPAPIVEDDTVVIMKPIDVDGRT